MQRQGQGRGFDRRETDRVESGLIDKVVYINRVTKVGKNFSFSALVVVGDGHGRVGFGSGKAKEVPAAIKKGIEIAKKNMIPISMTGTTIPMLRWDTTARARFCSNPLPREPALSPV